MWILHILHRYERNAFWTLQDHFKTERHTTTYSTRAALIFDWALLRMTFVIRSRSWHEILSLVYISANIMAHYKIRMQRLRWLLLNKSNLDGSSCSQSGFVEYVKNAYALYHIKKMMIFGNSWHFGAPFLTVCKLVYLLQLQRCQCYKITIEELVILS